MNGEVPHGDGDTLGDFASMRRDDVEADHLLALMTQHNQLEQTVVLDRFACVVDAVNGIQLQRVVLSPVHLLIHTK